MFVAHEIDDEWMDGGMKGWSNLGGRYVILLTKGQQCVLFFLNRPALEMYLCHTRPH